MTDGGTASRVRGSRWAVLHLPAFYVSSRSQSGIDFLPFFLRVVAFSFFMTWIFVNPRGSVLWAGVVPHMMFYATPHAGIAPVGWIAIGAGLVILVFAGKHMRGWGRPAVDLPQAGFLRNWRGMA